MRSPLSIRIVLYAALLLSISCMHAAGEPVEVDDTGGAIIHGRDDRQDVRESTDRRARELALHSVAALLPDRDLSDEDILDSPALGETLTLCPGERFADQPVLARCSAVAVDRDLLLTTGQCVASAPSCERQTWAFGYALTTDDPREALATAELYQCRSIPLVLRERTTDGSIADYAFVQLDRKLPSDDDIVVLSRERPPVGAALSVIGFPSGLPVKIDRGARLEGYADDGALLLSSDTFERSGGSGVFNANWELVGTLLHDSTDDDDDYDFDEQSNCRRARRAAGADRRGLERAAPAIDAVERLCESGSSRDQLCGRTSRCGDKVCSSDEHFTCTRDCALLGENRDESTGARMGCAVAAVHGTTTGGLEYVVLGSWLYRRRRVRAAKRGGVC